MPGRGDEDSEVIKDSIGGQTEVENNTNRNGGGRGIRPLSCADSRARIVMELAPGGLTDADICRPYSRLCAPLPAAEASKTGHQKNTNFGH
jgi:hypothetical protein